MIVLPNPADLPVMLIVSENVRSIANRKSSNLNGLRQVMRYGILVCSDGQCNYADRN